MLATWQTRLYQSAARNGRGRTIEKATGYLCTLFFLCFCLALKGVLVGVGDGVPEGAGVGDGRTRGCANIP